MNLAKSRGMFSRLESFQYIVAVYVLHSLSSTIHAIFNRLSVDAIAGRMASVRDDDRFKIIGPEDILVPYRSPAMHQGPDKSGGDIVEVWFDWAFVDFWKNNYCESDYPFS